MSLIIQVSELHFSSNDGIKVLEDVHLRVDRGEMLFLVGPAAAGKSVLLGLLATHIPPQNGQILVHGRNIARLSRKKAFELRRRIGFLPQGFTPLSKTVLENVIFKLRTLGDFQEQAEEKGLAALEQAELTAKLTLPAAELEPLDRVRLGLALAICNEPLLLLLDEPFEGLEPGAKPTLYSLLKQIHSGGFTVLVATRGPLPTVTATGHRVVQLSEGRVKEQ